MQRYRQEKAEFTGNVATDASVDLALLVVKRGVGGKWEDALVPDVGVNVKPSMSLAVKSDKITWCEIVPGEGERNDKRRIPKGIKELATIWMVIGVP